MFQGLGYTKIMQTRGEGEGVLCQFLKEGKKKKKKKKRSEKRCRMVMKKGEEPSFQEEKQDRKTLNVCALSNPLLSLFLCSSLLCFATFFFLEGGKGLSGMKGEKKSGGKTRVMVGEV